MRPSTRVDLACVDPVGDFCLGRARRRPTSCLRRRPVLYEVERSGLWGDLDPDCWPPRFCRRDPWGTAVGNRRRAGNGRGEFFENQIRPLLVSRCFKCHTDEKKPKGGLRLDSRDRIVAGGESGPAVIPERPEESLLLQVVG